MQEKSNKESEYRKAAVDSFTDYIRKHDDIVASISLALVIMLLFKITCVLTLT